MQAGELKHKITILHNTSDGTTKPTWENLFEKPLRAAKQGLSEKLFYEAAAEKSEDFSTFVIRYTQERLNEIRPTMRIIDNGEADRPYEIVGSPVDIDDSRKWLKIHARRIGTNGS